MILPVLSSVFGNTDVQEENDIPSQHICPLTHEPPFDAVHFDGISTETE